MSIGENSTDNLQPSKIDHLSLAFLFYNTILFIIGGPLNLLASCRLYREIRTLRRRFLPLSNLLMLKLNLHISDLLIIFVHLPKEITWRSTTYWLAGDVMCKAMKLVDLFAFHLSSFSIVSLAAERTFLVKKMVQASKDRNRKGGSLIIQSKSVKLLIGCSWVGAVILSLPQVRYCGPQKTRAVKAIDSVLSLCLSLNGGLEN